MRPRTAKKPPSLTLTPLESAEELGERFDEATEHAHQHDEFAEVRLGPTVPVPMGQLKPGVLAWRRALTTGSQNGELVYVIRPGPTSTASPFTGQSLARFGLRLSCRGPPKATLLLSTNVGRSTKTFRALARQVCENLETESD